MRQASFFSRFVLPVYCLLLYFFLFAPIIVLILFSFNDSAFPYEWRGFSLRWYYALWHSTDIIAALKTSLIVAFSSVILSLVMGTMFVFYSSKTIFTRAIFMFYTTLAAPEIVLAVGALSFFSMLAVPLGITTLIAAHTIIGLGYVIPILQSRFEQLSKRYAEASYDLGATQGQTLTKVIVPLLLPSLFAASLLVFIISFDDFVISFFTAGSTTQTLPMYIYAMLRSGTSPVVNALSTLMLLVSCLIVLLFSLLQVKKMDMLQ